MLIVFVALDSAASVARRSSPTRTSYKLPLLLPGLPPSHATRRYTCHCILISDFSHLVHLRRICMLAASSVQCRAYQTQSNGYSCLSIAQEYMNAKTWLSTCLICCRALRSDGVPGGPPSGLCPRSPRLAEVAASPTPCPSPPLPARTTGDRRNKVSELDSKQYTSYPHSIYTHCKDYNISKH